MTVENGTANRYTATVIGGPNCVAEGATREEAVTRVKRRLTEQFKQVEIVPTEVGSTDLAQTTVNTEDRWAKFAGMYENNPFFDEVLDAVQAYRPTTDEDESVI